MVFSNDSKRRNTLPETSRIHPCRLGGIPVTDNPGPVVYLLMNSLVTDC